MGYCGVQGGVVFGFQKPVSEQIFCISWKISEGWGQRRTHKPVLSKWCLSEFPPITPGSSSHRRITKPRKVMLAKLTVAVEDRGKEFAAGKSIKHVLTASLQEPRAPHKAFPRANITLQWSPLAEPLMRPNWSDRVCLCTLASLSYPN